MPARARRPHLRRPFQITPDYLKDAEARGRSTSPTSGCSSRASRALKVWLSVSHFGVSVPRGDRPLARPDAARGAPARGERRSSSCCRRRRWGGLLPPPVRGGEDRRRSTRSTPAAGRVRGDGRGARVLHPPARALRPAAVRAQPHHAARRRRAACSTSSQRRRGRSPARAGAAGAFARHARRRAARGPAELRADRSRAAAAVRGLSAEQIPARRVLAREQRWSSRRGRAALGRRRDFYVVLEGAAEVEVDGERRRAIGPGDFFGELAALDRARGTATRAWPDRHGGRPAAPARARAPPTSTSSCARRRRWRAHPGGVRDRLPGL